MVIISISYLRGYARARAAAAAGGWPGWRGGETITYYLTVIILHCNARRNNNNYTVICAHLLTFTTIEKSRVGQMEGLGFESRA